MDDERLNQLLRKLDAPAEPDAGFADELFVRMRTETARPPAGRSPMLALIAAVLLLVVALATGLAVGTGVLRLPWLVADATPAPSTPVAEQSATPLPSAEATATASPSASPEPPTGDLGPGDLVETTVEGLIVRADPGTDAERLGTLALGAMSYVVGGPTEASGHPWYLVSGMGLPPATGCGPDSGGTEPFDCPIWFGWVAGADQDGSAWLAASGVECPEPPGELVELTLGRTQLELLHCYGDPDRWATQPRAGQDLVFRAWWPAERLQPPQCESPPEIAWLACPQVVLGWDPGYPEAIAVAVDPDAGVTLQQSMRPPESSPVPGTQTPAGEWIEVTAHLDDPGAVDCGTADVPTDAPIEAIRNTLLCRSTFVVTRDEATSAP